jgi:MFS family permease
MFSLFLTLCGNGGVFSMTTPRFDPHETGLLLRNRRLWQFLSSRVSSSIAYQMLSVAVGWQMYALTGSPLFLGLIGLAQFLPMFLLTLVVGHVADRYDRLTILRACQVIEGAGALSLAAGSYYGWLGKEGVLAIVVILSAARAFEAPTSQALMPGLVRAELFPRAVAWATSLGQTAMIVGPALGGLLYAAGVTLVYSTIGSLFLGSSLILSLIRMERRPVKHEPISLRSLFAGIAFIRSKPAIFGAISLDLFAVLLGGATALLPVYAHNILAVGPSGLGVLRSAPAAGALLMSLFLARHPLKRRMGRTMFIAVIVFGVATCVFAVSSSFPLSLIALAALGSADVISVVIRQSLVQMETPDAMRGRVSAVNSMFIGTSNQLGAFESGVTAAWFGVVPAVLIGGVGTIAVAAIWMRLFPALARFDRPKA